MKFSIIGSKRTVYKYREVFYVWTVSVKERCLNKQLHCIIYNIVCLLNRV